MKQRKNRTFVFVVITLLILFARYRAEDQRYHRSRIGGFIPDEVHYHRDPQKDCFYLDENIDDYLRELYEFVRK